MHTCICNDITCILYLHSCTCIRNVINTSKYIHMYNKRCLIISYQSKRQIVTILVPIIIEYQNKMTWNLTNCNSCQNITFEIVYGSLQASLWAEPRRPHQPQRPLAFSILVLIKTIWPQTITVRTVPQVQTLYTEAVATTKFISGSHLDLTTNWLNAVRNLKVCDGKQFYCKVDRYSIILKLSFTNFGIFGVDLATT